MLSSSVKRFILPFSTREETKNSFNKEIEAAAVFALTELERKKGGGLLIRQPEEKLLFIAKMAYPLWLFPRNETAFVFDGLNSSSSTLTYSELPPINDFMENLQKNSRTRENYMAFLSDYFSYFQESPKEKKLTLSGLVIDFEFQNEFYNYRKESSELIGQNTDIVLLSPAIGESAISSIINELDSLRTFFKKEAESLPDCLKLINKLTSQFITELNFEADAVKEEYDAKIKATQELVQPRISKLSREYNQRIKSLAKNFDEEIQTLEKQKNKTSKLIASTECKIKEYLNQARRQASKKHLYSEKRWKQKSNQTKKALSEIKNRLDQTQNSIKILQKQKTAETFKLASERDAKIKEARQPIAELEASRDAKMVVLRQETEKLIKRAKPIVDRLSTTAKHRDSVTAKFEALGTKNEGLKTTALFYVPFYLACYRTGLNERYYTIPPSKIGTADFTAKLKGAFGMSKIKRLLAPRFTNVTSLIESIPKAIERSSLFESQIKQLGEGANILENKATHELISKGLLYLNHEGWISDKEHQELTGSLPVAKSS